MRLIKICSLMGIVIMLSILSACAPKQNFDHKMKIAQANSLFMDAMKQGDANKLASLYTMKAKLLPPHHEMLDGRENIQKFWQGVMESGVKNVNLSMMELESFENTAIEVSTYTITSDIGDILDSGKYIVIWKKENNQWKMSRDIFNSDLPLPAKEEAAPE